MIGKRNIGNIFRPLLIIGSSLTLCMSIHASGETLNYNRDVKALRILNTIDVNDDMGIFDIFKGKSGAKKDTKEKAYDVHIPEERLIGAVTEISDKPYVCVFNGALLEVSPKTPFRWYLSLIIRYDDVDASDMPNSDDTSKMEDFIDYLCDKLNLDKLHPNALFLGRVTGDSKTQAMWYVYNPEIANEFLQGIISSGNYPLHFEFVMEQDPEWEQAHFWLDPLTEH